MAMSNKLTKFLLKGSTVFFVVPLAATLWLGPTPAGAADFELAMVIKSTTNPYYKATLAGAQIAAQETGGKVENYGPTESSASAQVRPGSVSAVSAYQ